MRLEDKVAVVTGAGTGLGRATMELFASEGAKVVGCGRRREKGDEVVAAVTDAGGEAAFVESDISKAEDVQRVIAEAVDRYGGLDILVNNASVGPNGPYSMGAVADIPDEDWDAVIGVNLTGTFLFCKYAIRRMLESGGGVIANVSSIGGIIGMHSNHNYCASKAGVISLTKCIGAAYANRGIRANSLVAGSFDSDFIAPYAEGIKTILEDDQLRYMYSPVGRMSTPEELAPALLFLCSDESSYMYGECMVVDGAQTIAPIAAGTDS
jgi:NAD(P)-dependent dehydrogenase (short-subunit alcohol dehydrogenase family)